MSTLHELVIRGTFPGELPEAGGSRLPYVLQPSRNPHGGRGSPSYWPPLQSLCLPLPPEAQPLSLDAPGSSHKLLFQPLTSTKAAPQVSTVPTMRRLVGVSSRARAPTRAWVCLHTPLTGLVLLQPRCRFLTGTSCLSCLPRQVVVSSEIIISYWIINYKDRELYVFHGVYPVSGTKLASLKYDLNKYGEGT